MMKMFGPNSLSHIVHYLFKVIFIVILLFTLYVNFSFANGNYTVSSGRYYMNIPLTGTFIEGDYTKEVILTISLGLYFGALFFYVLSNIFKALKEPILFNRRAITSLHYFTILNLVIGPLFM